MRTSFRPAVWAIALICGPALGTASRPAAAPARAPVALPASSEQGGDASVPLPATLKSGMGYCTFAQAVMEQGWQLVDPLAADGCMAAGDCEIEFLAPGGSARLRVQVGSQAGAAAVQSWCARQVPLDRIGNTTAAAGDAKPAPAAVDAGNGSR
ncbi:hypothetical protein [Xanthomonas oryzae]|uniref:hypothetical protein n=1 Tax=Xanthomonas oryzae TaxID=347 RepID=UPI0010347118|nr:hypothetical protein [Xanthomonas oryzae]QBG99120.1 hypothetical protein EYC56_06635 [Xanthomonas oryzae]